jgi:hypothetical protein
MHISVFGSGMVGRAVAARLAQEGHDLVIGTRDPEATLARTEAGAMGQPPFREWHAEHPAIPVRTFAEAAAEAELIVNATSGDGALPALTAAGEENLAGKVVIDIANPLDFSAGFPPTLFVKDTDSLAEQLQRAFPQARIVKALNTTNATVMVDPASVGGGDHTLFMSGNDAEAKATVRALLQSIGWHDVIDLGDISTARGTEMLLPIWLRLMGALGTPMFNFKIAR